jgi:hypothetical protein
MTTLSPSSSFSTSAHSALLCNQESFPCLPTAADHTTHTPTSVLLASTSGLCPPLPALPRPSSMPLFFSAAHRQCSHSQEEVIDRPTTKVAELSPLDLQSRPVCSFPAQCSLLPVGVNPSSSSINIV